jgi:hypothetical protein
VGVCPPKLWAAPPLAPGGGGGGGGGGDTVGLAEDLYCKGCM